MQEIRPAAVAGMFYPVRQAACRRCARVPGGDKRVDRRRCVAKGIDRATRRIRLLGPVAASAYARLAPGRETIRRVVLLGPVHRVPVRGLALPAATAFATPLGSVPVDREAAELARALPQVVESTAAHAHEHSLEVQLPFLQSVLGEFAIVPFAVGEASPEEVAEVIELLWGGRETLIVVSSDLSHYHPYGEARQIDRRTADTVLALAGPLDHEQACGATPINGFALCARRHALSPELLDLRNSGDTAGDKSRVVGYAAFTFSEVAAHA